MRSYLLFQMNIIFLRFEVRYLYTQLVTKKHNLDQSIWHVDLLRYKILKEVATNFNMFIGCIEY